VLVLITTEAALRLLSRPAKGGKEQRERNLYTEYDPVLGWRKTPGAAVVYDRREYHVEYRVNGRGLRGPDRPYEKPSGVSRVLALGDSFVEAFMVDGAQTVTARIQAGLERRGCRAEVINGGTVGYSTDQEYLFYRDEGHKYSPDVVIVFVYQNDIPYLVLDDYLGYPKPRLDFATQPPTVVNEPVPRYAPVPPPAPEAPSGDAPSSYLVELVKDGLERTSAPTYNALARLGVWPPLRMLPMNDELRLFRVPELGHLRPAWAAFTWTIETLSQAVAADGGHLALAYVPSRMEVNPRTWALTKVRYGLDAKEFDRGAVADRVRYIAGRLKVPVVDLTEPLARADGLLRPTYFQTDSHWNARGQDVAGRSVAGFLGEAGLLPGCR
ncbi:MAG TPA: SGNH/GDSL hydrolase family protein, partial [Vicinamibacteria bacterium]|nr:SGNH/GDSL hydrolase family protein [Vicinamibacteria bacterium]